MRRLLWVGAALLLAAACNKSGSEGTATAAATSAAATPAAAASATSTTVAMASTSGGSAAATASPAANNNNILGLSLPALNKTVPTWKYGVPAPNPFPAKFDPKKDYYMTMHTTLGDMTFKFFPDVAPKHVTSFIYLAQIGYYDDVPFHRICTGFMMQGGDPSGQGTGGPAYHVPAEFNSHKHKRGILSMARTMDPNSAGSQFFVMFTDYPSLDGQYTVFGEMTDGEATLKKFENIGVTGMGNACPPKSIEKIKSIDVFTKDKGAK